MRFLHKSYNEITINYSGGALPHCSSRGRRYSECKHPSIAAAVVDGTVDVSTQALLPHCSSSGSNSSMLANYSYFYSFTHILNTETGQKMEEY